MSIAAATLSTTSRTPFAQSTEPQASKPRLRITRRGRAVLASLVALPVIAVLGVMAMVGGGGSAVATGATSGVDFSYLTVQAGQSLWSIAESIDPDGDPRDVIAEIRTLNQLESSSVQPGQRIAIPADLAN